MTKVRLEIECSLEDLHDLDRKGFKYMEDVADEEQMDRLAIIKFCNFVMDNSNFTYCNVRSLKRVEDESENS